MSEPPSRSPRGPAARLLEPPCGQEVLVETSDMAVAGATGFQRRRWRIGSVRSTAAALFHSTGLIPFALLHRTALGSIEGMTDRRCEKHSMWKRSVWLAFWLTAGAAAIASPIDSTSRSEELLCGTDGLHDVAAGGGILTVAKACEGSGCTAKMSYRTFHGGTFDVNVFTGRKTKWLVPTSLTLTAPDADMLVRLSEGLYAYLAALLGDEPSGAGLQSIALVPCATNDSTCNSYGGFGRIGSKGIELYYHERDDVSLVASGHRSINRLRRLAASSNGEILLHEMAHNFDFAGGRHYPVHDSMHYWTAIVQYLAFVERYDSTPRSFLEYDSAPRDATARVVADDYFKRYLEDLDPGAGAALAACLRGRCEDPSTRAQLIAITLRLETLAGDGFLHRFVAMTNAGQGREIVDPAERFFVVASRAAGADLSCVMQTLAMPLPAGTKRAMATAGPARPEICGTDMTPGAAFLSSGFPEREAVASGGDTQEAVVVALPVRLGIDLAADVDETSALDVEVEIPPGNVLRMSACADRPGDAQAAIWMRNDGVAAWPELPGQADAAIGLACEPPRTLVPHRGQTRMRLHFEGHGRKVADLWVEALPSQAWIPDAVAHTVGPASNRTVAWSFNHDGGGAENANIRADTLSVPVQAPARTLALPRNSSLIELRHGPTASKAVNAALSLRAIPVLSMTHLEGLWYDPKKPGFGLQVLRGGRESASLAIVSIYTYQGTAVQQEGAGEPTWLVGTARLPDAGSLAVTLDVPAAAAPHRSVEWGAVVLTPDGDDLLAEYTGRSGLHGYSRLIKLVSVADASLTGTWYDPAAPGTGWNLMVSPNGQLVATHYGKDSQGRAEWHFGSSEWHAGKSTRVVLQQASGGLFLDRQLAEAPVPNIVGTVTFRQIDCNRVQITSDLGTEAFAASLVRVVDREGSCRE